MALQSSQRASRTAILHEEVLQDSSAPIPAPIPAPILHVHSTENSTCRRQRALRVLQSSSRNSTHRRQGDLLEMHPCVLQDIPGNSSCSRDIPDIPVIHDLPAFQAILQCSSISRESTPFQHSPIRMHILQFYSSIGFQKTPPSTSWAITDITNIHSSKKGRCCDIGQIDRLFIIELLPFIVLSSDNTNCKNDIQLFHQLFDELSVYRDYH